MEEFFLHIEKFLSHPIVWGITTLVALALALSGKFSVPAATWIMWAAYAMAVFGVYRATVYFGIDALLRLLAVGCAVFGLAIGVVLINRWIQAPKVEEGQSQPPAPSTGKKPNPPLDTPPQTPSVPPSAPSKPIPPKPAPPADDSSVTLRAYLQPNEEYLEGTIVAGIVWDKNLVDVRLDIANGARVIQNLDFTVELDTSIGGLGQISQFPGITAFPARAMPPAWLEGTDPTGKPISVPTTQAPGMMAIAPIYRVHCSSIFADTVVHLAVASVALNPVVAGQLPQQLFAPRRFPKVIRVKGKYETLNGAAVETHPIDFSYEFKQQ